MRAKLNLDHWFGLVIAYGLKKIGQNQASHY